VAERAKDMIGRPHHTTGDILRLDPRKGEGNVTDSLIRRHGNVKRRSERKWSLQQDPGEVIPFHEGKEEGEEVLKEFENEDRR
jgi:hypothetical protein